MLEASPPSKPASQAPCLGIEALVGNEKRCLKPKDSFKDCDTCPEIVVVPAGEFIMGSSVKGEGPPCQVRIPTGGTTAHQSADHPNSTSHVRTGVTMEIRSVSVVGITDPASGSAGP
jgi:hypothetical protein